MDLRPSSTSVVSGVDCCPRGSGGKTLTVKRRRTIVTARVSRGPSAQLLSLRLADI